MAASATTTKQPVQFTIDLSDGQTQSEPTKFDNLCDSVTSCYISHGNCLTELYKLKDELLKHSLPPCLLLQLTLASSRIFRSYSDLSVPMREMARMVKQYSMPWEEKGTVLKKLKADYESKRQQLSIAVKHLEMVASEEDRMQHERRLNNWMRLYSRVMASKSHGRRWKFRIEPFKKKLAQGYNPYGSDSSDSEDDTDEEESSVVSGSGDERDMSKTTGLPNDLSQALASRLSGDLTKRVRFSARDLSARPPGSPVLATPPSPTPAVETAEVACWTEEPEYTDYLLVLLYRPKGLLYDRDICCTLSLEGQFYKSQVFEPDGEETNGLAFHFLLSEKAAKQLAGQPTDEEEDDEELSALISGVKLTVAVFPRTVAEPMAAHCSIPLSDLELTEDETVLVPPNTRDVDPAEGEEESSGFLIDWDQLSSAQLDLVQSAVEYPLKCAAIEDNEGEEEDVESATLPLVCHRVRVQRHKLFHTATSTDPWNSVLEEEGYRKMKDTVSAATSAIALPDKPQTPPPLPSPQPQEKEEEEKEERMTAEQVEALTLRHVEEMKQLQEQYEKKLVMLSRTLARVKKDKEEQIQTLEQALSESEASKGRKPRSSNDIQAWLERRRRLKTLNRGLPEWGKDLPKNFFERLEMFAVESLQKHQELTERIRREVQEAYEKQLALQHKLAPPTTNTNAAMDDVCLPALFLPTNPVSSRALVFNPRAHSYFHPPGSLDTRVSQPPSIFKLPPVQANQLATLNLYDLTHSNTAQTGPIWLKSTDLQYSLQPAPAPPPSACDFYNHREHSGGSRQPRFSPQPISGRNSRLDTS